MPATDEVLCRYVSYLAAQGLKHSTVKVYLSGVQSRGFRGSFSPYKGKTPVCVAGFKRCEAEKGGNNRRRLLITPDILRKVKAVWERKKSDLDIVMRGGMLPRFLRMGEMTVPSDRI